MSKEELRKAVEEAVAATNYDYAIRSVKLFGSELRGEAGPNSDVDLIVEFDDKATVGLFALSEIEDVFRQFLNREADITTPDGLDELIRDRILAEAVTIYER